MDDTPSWRVLVDQALSGPANMARDHALATGLRPRTGTVRFYRWTPATLSLGRNEPVTAGYREFLRQRPGIGVVRRPTGGRAVIHDRELTYCIVLPTRAFGGPRRAYRRINEGLVAGLRTLGVDACAASGRALLPDAGPCFLEPAEGEVVVADRKVAGSAQARIGKAVLQHGSLLLVADQSSLFGDGQAHSARPITLSEILGTVPPWTRLVDALTAGFTRTLGGNWSVGRMTEYEETLAAEFETQYASPAWTWRRQGAPRAAGVDTAHAAAHYGNPLRYGCQTP